jgi:hypothetical protein
MALLPQPMIWPVPIYATDVGISPHCRTMFFDTCNQSGNNLTPPAFTSSNYILHIITFCFHSMYKALRLSHMFQISMLLCSFQHIENLKCQMTEGGKVNVQVSIWEPDLLDFEGKGIESTSNVIKSKQTTIPEQSVFKNSWKLIFNSVLVKWILIPTLSKKKYFQAYPF